MEETRPINDQRICHINNEENFFLLIEQRYKEQGYELLETCSQNQHAHKVSEFSRKQKNRDKDLEVQREDPFGLEAVFSF